MEHPEQSSPQVTKPSVRVDQLGPLGVGQRIGHRIDGEVTAGEVLGDRRRAHLRERARMRIGLGARPSDVDLDAAELEPPGQEEALSLELEARHLGEGFDLALDRHVQVRSVADPEQQIANGAAHQVCRDPLGDAAQYVDSGETVHQLGEPSRVDFT